MIIEPKFKAQELILKFYDINEIVCESGTNPYISKKYVKECIKITIAEILKSIPNYDINPMRDFWVEVEKEVEMQIV